MYLLEKEVTFEAAHRLGMGYIGKCNNIHGHSWKVKIGVECEYLDMRDMGVDFAELKTVLKEIENEYDHTTILYEHDTEFVSLLQGKTALVLIGANPTSEVIARLIFERIEYNSLFNSEGVKLKYVIVEETCTSRCVYSK